MVIQTKNLLFLFSY